jgi:dephospho-CoA kinase
VSDLFAQLDIPVIDTDIITHQVTEKNGIAIPALKESFGADIFYPDDSLKRYRLRELVFSDPKARRKLENILHPMVRKVVLDQLDSILTTQAGTPYVIVVIPLLAETTFMQDYLDRIVVTQSDQEVQIARVMARNDMTREEVLNILSTQANAQARLSIADDIIDNNSDIAALEHQVKKLDAFYRTQFA